MIFSGGVDQQLGKPPGQRGSTGHLLRPAQRRLLPSGELTMASHWLIRCEQHLPVISSSGAEQAFLDSVSDMTSTALAWSIPEEGGYALRWPSR